jgi:hypothetical protein
MGLCYAFISHQHIFGHAGPEIMSTKKASITCGASFGLLLVYLSIAIYLFRAAEDNAQKETTTALMDAKNTRKKAEEANAAKL